MFAIRNSHFEIVSLPLGTSAALPRFSSASTSHREIARAAFVPQLFNSQFAIRNCFSPFPVSRIQIRNLKFEISSPFHRFSGSPPFVKFAIRNSKCEIVGSASPFRRSPPIDNVFRHKEEGVGRTSCRFRFVFEFQPLVIPIFCRCGFSTAHRFFVTCDPDELFHPSDWSVHQIPFRDRLRREKSTHLPIDRVSSRRIPLRRARSAPCRPA